MSNDSLACLAHGGWWTQREIVAATRLPSGTVRHLMRILVATGMVVQHLLVPRPWYAVYQYRHGAVPPPEDPCPPCHNGDEM